MSEKHIVLIPAARVNDGRAVAELIQDRPFESIQAVAEVVNKEGNTLCCDIQVMSLSQFMDDCNDEAIDLDTVWVTYVNIGKD